MPKRRLYRVLFQNQGKAYEVYAKRVSSSNLHGFIEVEGLVFGEKSAIVVDPSEDRLRSEFDGVSVSYIPIYSVIRVDEVEKQGTAKIVSLAGKESSGVSPFSLPPIPKKGGD
jgi:hypothetical protein